MTRAFVFLAAVVLGMALAQSSAKLEAFIPAPLPETQMPNPVPKTMATIPSGSSFGGPCLPSLKDLKVPTDVSGAKPNPAISKKIQAIVDADQAARKGVMSDTEAIRDQARREALLPMIPKAVSSQDFANIALVFQHGDCVPLFMLANRMALMAIKTAVPNAKYGSHYADPKWLYAATLDRALMNSIPRRAQKYGTQYFGFDDQCTRLYVVDPRTTDAERKAYGVPTLQEALENAKKMATPNCK